MLFQSKIIVFAMTSFVACCAADIETLSDLNFQKDFGPEPDGLYKVVEVSIDAKIPDLGEHLCSPAGHYTFYVAITENSCPPSIVKKVKWTSSAFLKSYDCGLYFMDGYSFLDDGKILYCAYYTDAKPNGLKQWAECTVYSPSGIIFCEFKFSAPFVVPD